MVDTEVLLDTGATTLSIVTAAELSFQPNRSEREAKRPPTAPTKQYDFITAVGTCENVLSGMVLCTFRK
jgi:hypothetical protein